MNWTKYTIKKLISTCIYQAYVWKPQGSNFRLEDSNIHTDELAIFANNFFRSAWVNNWKKHNIIYNICYNIVYTRIIVSTL